MFRRGKLGIAAAAPLRLAYNDHVFAVNELSRSDLLSCFGLDEGLVPSFVHWAKRLAAARKPLQDDGEPENQWSDGDSVEEDDW